jgi:hypothetical protein
MASPISPHSATHQVSGTRRADLPTRHPTPLHQHHHPLAGLASCVTPSLTKDQISGPTRPTTTRKQQQATRLASPAPAWTSLCGHGNINPLSIDYACRPRLRPRLTLGGRTCPRNPWSSGGRVSHSAFATHACILTRMASTTRSPRCFDGHTTLPYPPTHPHHTPQQGTARLHA